MKQTASRTNGRLFFTLKTCVVSTNLTQLDDPAVKQCFIEPWFSCYKMSPFSLSCFIEDTMEFFIFYFYDLLQHLFACQSFEAVQELHVT